MNREYRDAVQNYLTSDGSRNLRSLGDLFDFFLERARVPYALGRLYEVTGDQKNAIKFYEQAVERWKHADSGLKEPEDAMKRLMRLKEGF